MGRRWEAIPALHLLIFLALCRNDGAESFGVLKLRHDVTEDSCQSCVVLWCVGGGWEIFSCPSTEPDARAFFRVKRYVGGDDTHWLYRDVLEEGWDVVTIV